MCWDTRVPWLYLTADGRKAVRRGGKVGSIIKCVVLLGIVRFSVYMAVYVRITVFLCVPVCSRDVLPVWSGLKISHNVGCIAFPQNIPAYAPNYTAVKVKLTLEKTTKVQREVEVKLCCFFNLGRTWFGWSKPRLGRFSSWERDPTPVIQEAGWAPGPLWTGVEKSPLLGFDPRTLASLYTDWDVPVHKYRAVPPERQ